MIRFEKERKTVLWQGGPAYLKTADEAIGDVILEQMSSFVVYTRPSPHVLVIIGCFALIEDGCTNGPHDDAEDEESDGEDGVVSCDFLCAAVTSFPVGNNDDDGH